MKPTEFCLLKVVHIYILFYFIFLLLQVCASHDPQAFKYNIQIRLQPPRAEIIQDMEDIMKQHLLYFYHDTKQKPERIIFYRDGVSEGQFREVFVKVVE